ncbi:hypothetical protein DFH08DRAFT_1044098 [Mycena albidolilacea]|uniref:Uncharacterized protein n=1 Tax=Mycena albidolilacea TaxID=1033008 RepID=A0AAD6Z942_9AGAR|nr:hypothetical protein DFH08DRAFT_1044098 [Mycena albidolilacea]
MDIGAFQPLPARIPLKPTQVPLQVPAAAKPQTQCRVSRSASELFLASPPPCIAINSGFKTDLTGQVFAFFAHQTIGTDATNSRLQFHGGEGSEDCDGHLSLPQAHLNIIKISSPSYSLSRPSPGRAVHARSLSASHLHLPDVDSVMTISQMPWALTWSSIGLRVQARVLAPNALIGLQRRMLEPPSSRRVTHSDNETVEASTMPSALSTHREIHQHQHMRAANANPNEVIPWAKLYRYKIYPLATCDQVNVKRPERSDGISCMDVSKRKKEPTVAQQETRNQSVVHGHGDLGHAGDMEGWAGVDNTASKDLHKVLDPVSTQSHN